ncbi:unnamed protein product [Caenorhabditis brenneri]
MIPARTVKEIDAINTWRVENSPKTVVLPAMEIFSIAIHQWVQVEIEGEPGPQAYWLANDLMARLLQVTREFLVLKKQDNHNKIHLERKAMTNGFRSWMQFPVVLAECITVHKSQGMTFDGNVLATGMMYKSAAGSFYTAVSRVRSLASPRIANVEKDPQEAAVLARIRLGEESDEIRGFLHHRCRMQGSEPADIFRELRHLENDEPGKDFMILARTNGEVDRMNRWKFDNSPKSMVLDPLDVPLARLGSGFALRSKKREALIVVVGGKVMVTHNLKLEGLANGIMARLLKVTREHLVLERLDNRKKVFLERKVFTDGRHYWLQFPVVMAEVITVNKSQGMTYDGGIVATVGMPKWSSGCFYTALSRARSLKDC